MTNKTSKEVGMDEVSDTSVDSGEKDGTGTEIQLIRVRVWLDASVLRAGQPGYKGGATVTEKFESMSDVYQFIIDLAAKGKHDSISSIRLDDVNNSSGVRAMARDILDADILRIGHGDALEAVARYGGQKYARIIAVRKLLEKGLAGDSQIEKVMREIISGEGPEKYIDSDIAELARKSLAVLGNTSDDNILRELKEFEANVINVLPRTS